MAVSVFTIGGNKKKKKYGRKGRVTGGGVRRARKVVSPQISINLWRNSKYVALRFILSSRRTPSLRYRRRPLSQLVPSKWGYFLIASYAPVSWRKFQITRFLFFELDKERFLFHFLPSKSRKGFLIFFFLIIWKQDWKKVPVLFFFVIRRLFVNYSKLFSFIVFFYNAQKGGENMSRWEKGWV